MRMNDQAACDPDEGHRQAGEQLPVEAGFPMRLAALLIDTLLLGAINAALLTIPVMLAWHYTVPVATASLLGVLPFLLFVLFSPLLLSFFYCTILQSFGGQTVGMIFLGIRVVTPEQGSLTLGTSFLRWCAHFLSLLPLGAGYLWALVDPQHATLHDRIAATRVVVI